MAIAFAKASFPCFHLSGTAIQSVFLRFWCLRGMKCIQLLAVITLLALAHAVSGDCSLFALGVLLFRSFLLTPCRI